MPDWLTIDTCNLYKLVGKSEISPILMQLKLWADEGRITFIVPATLLEEWEKHQYITAQLIRDGVKKWKEHARKLRTIEHAAAEIAEEEAIELEEQLLSQITIINDLFRDHSVQIKISPEIERAVEYARANKKAPFHKTKKDHRNDARILFSAADYVNRQENKTLSFISANHNEFGMSGQRQETLHPDIMELFPGVTFDYSRDIYPWIQAKLKKGYPPYRKMSVDETEIKYIIKIDKKAPLLDQVYEYLTKRFVDINILPKRLFIEHYPFITGKKLNNYHRPFTLLTDNKPLFDLMTSLQVNGTEVSCSIDGLTLSEEDKEKAKRIMHILYHNFLYRIAYKLEESTPLTYTSKKEKCNCDICLYYRFDFAHFHGPLNEDADIETKMQRGYVLYKMHDYAAALKIFEDLLNTYDKKDLKRYIIAFNCKQLGWLISQTYWENPVEQDWAKLLSASIDLQAIVKMCRLAHPENDRMLQWMQRDNFYRDALLAMYKEAREVIEIKNGKSGGTNSSSQKLQEAFLSSQAFLDRNYIIYDEYSVYQPIFELYAEGLTNAMQWSTAMGGRLVHFNDHLIRNIILSGKYEWIRKLYYRAEGENFPYQPSPVPHLHLKEIALNLIKHLSGFLADETNSRKDIYFSMFEQKKEWLLTALTLVAVTELDSDAVEKIVCEFLPVLSNQKVGNDLHVAETIEFLLDRKAKLLSVDTIRQLIMDGLRDKSLLYNDNIMGILAHAVESTNREINFNAEEFAEIKKQLLNTLQEKGEEPIYMLRILFDLLSPEQRKETSMTVTLVLQQEFNPDRFYFSVMSGIIQPSAVFVDKYFQYIAQYLNVPATRHWFSNKRWNTESALDYFMNFIFRFTLDIPENIKVAIAGRAAYYKWLLAPDNVDEEDFQVGWVAHHLTAHKIQWLRRSLRLKEHLWKIIRKNRLKDAYKVFSEIYAFDN